MTATRAALLELADRCEKASGPDRELDVDIWRLCVRPDAPLIRESLPWSACYTASLDAALSLVPKGWGGKFWWSRGLKHPGVSLERSYPTNREVFAEGKTAPTTMCAAALRALAAEAGDE